ncbi:MAG: hypothetical protein IT181_21785 [Acidobacteria bacterium]|nr:hypothetical protein [Acidobacteriota bacterium]
MNGRRWIRPAWLVALAGVCLLAAAPADAQQRPLVTEDPQTVGAGQVLIETGVDWMQGVTFPISGLRGDLVSGPTIGLSVGVGPIAEIQIDGSPYRQLRITERREAPLSAVLSLNGATTSAVDDFVIATKLRLLNEGRGRPAIGLRFATRLPNASNESGLGQDTTDFFASFLFGKTVARVRLVANAGVAIVGDPVVAARQEDLLTFGMSLAGRLGRGVELVSEYNGRMNLAASSPVPGTENRGVARAGLRFSRGSLRLDAAALMGATSTDLDLGATAGLTWVFRAFQMP